MHVPDRRLHRLDRRPTPTGQPDLLLDHVGWARLVAARVVQIFDGAMDSVPRPDAQATFRAFAAAGVCQELVTDHGCSPDRFKSWLADTLRAQLL